MKKNILIFKSCLFLFFASMPLGLFPHSHGQTFDKTALAWTLPWDADWVTAISFAGPNRLAAGNNLGRYFAVEFAGENRRTGAIALP